MLVKITELNNIGSNISYQTLIPVVDTAGNATTEKANLQIVGNLILNGAGGSNFPRAAQANIALSVANAAQPNITSVGTLTNLTVSGNVTANLFIGNILGNLTNAVFATTAGTVTTNAQPNITSVGTLVDLTVTNNITTSANISANWVLGDYVAGNANPLFHIPSGNLTGVDGNISNVLRGDGSFGTFTGIQGLQGVQGILGVQGAQGSTGVQGIQGTQSIQGLQGSLGFQGIQGVTGSASLPLANGTSNIDIATANGNVTVTTNGTSTWTFDDTGNLTIPTNGQILVNNGGIISADNEDFTILVQDSDDDGFKLELKVDNGAGFTDSSVQIDRDRVEILTDLSGTGYGWQFNSDGRFRIPAEIYGSNNLIFTSNNFGVSYTWTLSENGDFVLADGNSLIRSIANSSLDPLNPNVSTMVFTPDSNYGSQVLVLDPTATGHIHLRAYAFSNIDEPAANIFLGGEDTSFEITSGSNNEARIHSGGNTWIFGNTGMLTVPGEGVIRSVNDTINLQSIDANSNVYSARLGTNGGLYFETTEYANGWLYITNNSGNANLYSPSGNIDLKPAFGVADAAGKSLNLYGGDADQSNYYTGTGGSVNITGGLGSTTDGGGGGPGGNINLSAGVSADPAGHAGNININSENLTWRFDYTGNLSLPGNILSNNTIFIDTRDNSNVADIDLYSGDDILLQGGIRTTTNQPEGGDINIFAGSGGPGSGGESSGGGDISLIAGKGGNAGDTDLGNFGGSINLQAGHGGDADVGNLQVAGGGGSLTIEAGDAGTNGGNTSLGRQGGSLNLYAGNTTEEAQNGAAVTIQSGYGGANALAGNLEINIPASDLGSGGTWYFNGYGNLEAPGNITASSNISGSTLFSTLASGNEGGELQLAKPPNGTLSGGITVDAYINQLRFFEQGGTTRGLFIDIANSPAGVSAAIGYRDIPQVVASNTTIAATDAGKHYYSTTAGNLTLTIPNNATTSFQTGTAISIVVQAAGNVLVNAASGVTLYMAGSSSAGNRAVGSYGMATLMKVATDTWFINGTGVY